MYLTSGNDTGINLEYWFRLIYECFTGSCYGTGNLATLLASWWVWITYIGYILIVLGLFAIVYFTVKIFDLRKREEEQLEHLIISPEAAGGNPRFAHIQSLMDSKNSSDWRQAIIEADIMLDDMLSRQSYTGNGVGEKLKQVEPSDFDTLQDAWEAHKVRNQIAHAGSTFDLSETLARRTVARYEAVFREFGAI
ncbi:MAG: hypothetical protein Q7R54_01355 [bacterium]|nr:hypothetical protein [bacterium]